MVVPTADHGAVPMRLSDALVSNLLHVDFCLV